MAVRTLQRCLREQIIRMESRGFDRDRTDYYRVLGTTNGCYSFMLRVNVEASTVPPISKYKINYHATFVLTLNLSFMW